MGCRAICYTATNETEDKTPHSNARLLSYCMLLYRQSQDCKVDIRFTLNRILMRVMHHAVDLVDLTVLFPDPMALAQHSPTLPLETEASRMIDAELNPSQQLVVRSILQSTYKKVGICNRVIA